MAEEGEELEVEMEAAAASGAIPFQLQFDKPFPFQIKIAEWNPEKDLLAMVTEDSKVLLHRFNWQRLWTISPGKCITALCWRPDGKAIALGLEDGSILLHDVENGKLLRSIKSHNVAVVCLNWEEDTQLMRKQGEQTRAVAAGSGFDGGTNMIRVAQRLHGLRNVDKGCDGSKDCEHVLHHEQSTALSKNLFFIDLNMVAFL